MSRRVHVTKAQQAAAKMIVERSTATGKTVRSSISRIANASGASHSRAATTGRSVSGSTHKTAPNK